MSILCQICYQDDFDGCGDGMDWFLEKDGEVCLFESREEAERAGLDETKGQPWQFSVVEVP